MKCGSYDAVNHSTVARWFKQFQEGRRSIEDNVHTGRPSTSIDNTPIVIMSALLDKGGQTMVQEMVSGIPKTIDCILLEYLMKKKVVEWRVPHMLFPGQKQCCVELCQKLLIRY